MKKLTFNQERYDNFRQHFLDDIEMPEGFNDSAYKNDVFPSIEHESSRVHIYFADIDGWLGDFGQPDPDWNKYLFQSHPTEMVYAMADALADDPKFVSFETSDWNEILEKIEEWRATQTEDEPQTYKDSFEGDQCPECGEFSVSGEVFRATGAKLDSGYQPSVGETLKFISMECSECDFDQYS